MNRWAIAFPFLLYLGSVGAYLSPPQTAALRANVFNTGTGILFLYRTLKIDSSPWETIIIHFSIPYFSVSISLNVLLTLMIITRLVLHNRGTRTSATALAGTGGLYKTIITMLIESSALYAVCSLLVIGTFTFRSSAADLFLPILAEAQVRAFPRPVTSGSVA